MSAAKLLLISCLLFGSACCKEESIPQNLDLLYSSLAKDRNDAALALARCGKKASPAVGRLGELLYDDNVGVQSAASYALRQIGTKEAQNLIEAAKQN